MIAVRKQEPYVLVVSDGIDGMSFFHFKSLKDAQEALKKDFEETTGKKCNNEWFLEGNDEGYIDTDSASFHSQSGYDYHWQIIAVS